MVTATAAAGDQAWIRAVGDGADEVPVGTRGAQPPGGADLDEEERCVVQKAPIACEELALLRPSAGYVAGGPRGMDGGCSPTGSLERRVSHSLVRRS